jgi:glutathione S-transferase
VKVLDPGHLYALNVLDADSVLDGDFEPTGHLRFVKREGPKYPGNTGHYPGTTCQEALKACVDRLAYVNRQEFSDHTFLAGQLIVAAIWHLEMRAANRHGRKAPEMQEACEAPCCTKCNHVGCQGECH